MSTQVFQPAPGVAQRLLTLYPDQGEPPRPGELASWRGLPQMPYRVRGLVLFGADADATVCTLAVGQTEAIGVSPVEVPAEFFKLANVETLDELVARAEREDIRALQPARAWLFSDVAFPGVEVRLTTRGRIRAACVWGHALSESDERHKVEIRAASDERGGVLCNVARQRWLDETPRVVLEARTDNEATAIALAEALFRHRGRLY